MREGLVAARKTVTRLGVTYEQTYWVKPAELRAIVKTSGYKAAVAKLGGNVRNATRRVAGWVESPTEPGGLMTLAAATKMALGDDAEARWAEKNEALARTGAEDAGPEVFDRMSDLWHQGANEDGALTELAQVSQAFYEDEPEVELYRGIGEFQATQMEAAFSSGDDAVLDAGCLVSFSESPDIARGFAANDNGAVISIRVPRESIIMSHRAGMFGDEEREVAVLTKGAVRVSRSQFARASPTPLLDD